MKRTSSRLQLQFKSNFFGIFSGSLSIPPVNKIDFGKPLPKISMKNAGVLVIVIVTAIVGAALLVPLSRLDGYDARKVTILLSPI